MEPPSSGGRGVGEGRLSDIVRQVSGWIPKLNNSVNSVAATAAATEEKLSGYVDEKFFLAPLRQQQQRQQPTERF